MVYKEAWGAGRDHISHLAACHVHRVLYRFLVSHYNLHVRPHLTTGAGTARLLLNCDPLPAPHTSFLHHARAVPSHGVRGEAVSVRDASARARV